MEPAQIAENVAMLRKRWVIVRRWAGVTSAGTQATGLRYRSRRRAERRAAQMSLALADRGIWCEARHIDGTMSDG